MISTIIVYLLIVADYEECRTKPTLRCHVIYRNCPNVTHYPHLKTKRDLEREANMCMMSELDRGFIKRYQRRIK